MLRAYLLPCDFKHEIKFKELAIMPLIGGKHIFIYKKVRCLMCVDPLTHIFPIKKTFKLKRKRKKKRQLSS